MSLTIIQRFYELAKQASEAPALAVESDGHFQKLPWWFVKSKAKHFGLGLLQEGAKRGEYFYLFPTERPTWVYAELGALTVGLKTLPLPTGLSPERLNTLIRSFPPAFVFATPEDHARLLPVFKGSKSIRRMIWDSDSLKVPGEGEDQGPHSFRKVFNSGIIFENRHHAAYREIRSSLTEATVLSPVQVTPEGLVVEQELSYMHVNNLSANLSRACRQKKIRRLLARGDMTVTLTRAACLYWPLSLGIPAILSSPGGDLVEKLKDTRPNAAYLRAVDWTELVSWLAGRIPDGGGFRRILSRMKFRLGWARHLQAVLSTDVPPGSSLSIPESFRKIPWIHLDSRWLEGSVS